MIQNLNKENIVN